jgi:outer membrane protein assembly factor BamD (BamD/ComL family)
VAAQLFEAAAQKYPTYSWSNIGRLELAVQKFNAGDFAGAKKLADDITNTLPEKSKMTWIREIYWGAVYMRGSCLQAQGQTQPAAVLKQLAMSKFPDLNIQRRLR